MNPVPGKESLTSGHWGHTSFCMMYESFESSVTFKYFRTTLTNQNDIHDEIKVD
jgi:hypothetical protein